MRANVVGMPTRRCETGAGLTTSLGRDKTEATLSAEGGREETKAAAEDNESNRGA